jgi:hypothetical protein
MPCFHCHVSINLTASHSAHLLGAKKTWPNKIKRRLGIPVATRAEANRRTAVRAGNARPEAWGVQRQVTLEDWQAWAFRKEQQSFMRASMAVCWSKHPEVLAPIRAAQSLKQYYKRHDYYKAKARRRYEHFKNDAEWIQKRKEQRRKWDRDNAEYKKQRLREWLKANPERARAYKRASRRKQAAKPINRILSNVRKRLRDVIRGKRSALNVVGCTRKQLQEHLQSQFTKQMHWNNYGTYWHVDHIVPVSHFDLTNPEHVKLVHHYTNLRPMEAVANMKRGNKIERPHQIQLPL